MWIRRLRAYFSSDFAFSQDVTLRYLPLVVAFLTMLSITMTHSSAYIKHITLDGNESLKQRLHLHIPYDTPNADTLELFDQLASMGEIDAVEQVSEQEIAGFLESWLSIDDKLAKEFPLPMVLDIMLRADADRESAKKQLKQYLDVHIKDALLESYDDSLAAFNNSAQAVKRSIYLLSLIVLLAITMIIMIISRITLGVHKKHIEILHYMGADDHYINRQFIKRSALISIKGVVMGTLLSAVFIEIMKSSFVEDYISNNNGVFDYYWLYYFFNPLLIIILVVSAAWVTIESQLKHMP
jgi:cell division transport system permease protein